MGLEIGCRDGKDEEDGVDEKDMSRVNGNGQDIRSPCMLCSPLVVGVLSFFEWSDVNLAVPEIGSRILVSNTHSAADIHTPRVALHTPRAISYLSTHRQVKAAVSKHYFHALLPQPSRFAL
jgi:hypothetical protein